MPDAPGPWKPCWLLDADRRNWCAEQANGRRHCPPDYCLVADPDDEQLSLLDE